ncbi:MAG: DUF6496 domain-containing protein [Ilyomonas sp.]
MAKYGKKTQEKVKEVMDEWKEGKLKTGTGKKVKSQKQAVAIGLSEAREEGDKVPPRKTKKSAPKKAAKKAVPKKKTAKKAAPKKAAKKAPKKTAK